MRSKLVTILLVLGVAFGGGAAGVVAVGGDSDPGSAAKSEYKNGKGCGDRNHLRPRVVECPLPLP